MNLAEKEKRLKEAEEKHLEEIKPKIMQRNAKEVVKFNIIFKKKNIYLSGTLNYLNHRIANIQLFKLGCQQN